MSVPSQSCSNNVKYISTTSIRTAYHKNRFHLDWVIPIYILEGSLKPQHPWNHELDAKLMHEFKLSKKNKTKSLQVSLDVFNVLNLLNSDWGRTYLLTKKQLITCKLIAELSYNL